MIRRTQIEWDTNTLPPALVLDVGELDTGFVQATVTKKPAADAVNLAVEVSVDGYGWVDSQALGFLTPPGLIVDDGSVYGESNAFNGYKLTPYRYVRVRQTAATANAGRVLITLGAVTLPRNGKAYRVESAEFVDPINAQTGVEILCGENDSAGFQVSPLLGAFSGTLTLRPEVTYDGTGWVEPYLVTDRVSSGVTDTTFTGTSKISSHINITGAERFRVRSTGAAPTGSARITVFAYSSLYGPALEAAAKGV